jgi:GntR family transcriptional repressor for pyruvate dehydrogenase complex
VVDRIVDQIKGLLRDRRVGPGSKLPTERELAQQFRVSRPTVREALRTLALMGVIDKHHGSGTQIAASSRDVLTAPFEFMIMIDRPTLLELNEARSGLEVYVAGLAARRRTAEDLAALESAYRDLAGAATARASAEANVRFHQAVAAASHNRILERVMHSLHEGIRTSIRTLSRVVNDRERSLKVHEDVLAAIRKRDPEEARRAMDRHMALNREHLGQLAPRP